MQSQEKREFTNTPLLVLRTCRTQGAMALDLRQIDPVQRAKNRQTALGGRHNVGDDHHGWPVGSILVSGRLLGVVG